MADFTIKSNDRLPAIQAQLFSPSGEPIDLTGATITFIMRRRLGNDAGPIKVDAAATVVDVGQGVVRYDWKAVDTDDPGEFDAEWEIRFADGRKQTFPTSEYHDIAILADLDEE